MSCRVVLCGVSACGMIDVVHWLLCDAVGFPNRAPYHSAMYTIYWRLA